MADNVITVRQATAEAFLPADLHENGGIDLHDLAELAWEAMDGSDTSLAAAKAIADGGWVTQFFNSGAMQRHVIQSITHIRDISKVNLALSAICNDLAAVNLEHAKRIDSNHQATHERLGQVQTMTAELLEHLRRPREPALLERLLPALAQANPADQAEIQGWLKSMTEAIDLQYSALNEKINTFSAQIGQADEALAQAQKQLARLQELLVRHGREAGEEFDALKGALRQAKVEADDQVRQIAVALAGVETEGQRGLSRLTREMTKRHAEVNESIQAEAKARSSMQQAVVTLLKEREGAIRKTIGALNQHLLTRMLWVAGGVLALQLIGFGFLAFKMGLWK